jgi:hypothetical protein
MKSEPELEVLSAYLDDELDASTRRELEEHLPTCDSCRQRLEGLRSTVTAIQGLPKAVPPRAFTIPAQRPRRRPSFIPLAWASGAAAAMLVIVVLAGSLVHPPGGGAGGSSGSALNAGTRSASGGLGQSGAGNDYAFAPRTAPFPNQIAVPDPNDGRYSLRLSTDARSYVRSASMGFAVEVFGQSVGENAVRVVLQKPGFQVELDPGGQQVSPAALSFTQAVALSQLNLPGPGTYVLVATWTDPRGTVLVASLPVEISG